MKQEGVLSVSWGEIEVSWDEEGINCLSLPEKKGGNHSQPQGNVGELRNALEEYFQGKPVNFSFKINLSGLTPFQQKVLEAVKQIPYGETRSYQWVAEQIGSPRAYRAVGGAVGKNPVAILIP